MEWSIRGVSPADLEPIAALVRVCLPGSWGLDQVGSALSAPGARTWLAESAEGAPLGFLLARRIADLLEIDLLGVEPTARGRGIARALVETAIEASQAEQLSELRLELAERNEPARGLYAGLGFVVVGRRARYYPDGDDALLLSRTIARAPRHAPGPGRSD